MAELSPEAAAILPPLAQEKFRDLIRSSYVPHNGIGRTDEDLPAPPYPEMPRRELPPGSTGTVIVGCMKNEAPYIVEWVASHRAIGVDNFLIYTNGCEDGTDAILDRLQEMGVLQHRNNDDWKGNSPQQHALNRSLKEDVIRNAEWIAHIDVDEFINVRCGNGTVQDFLDRVPNATNIAMTWRLFRQQRRARAARRIRDRPVRPLRPAVFAPNRTRSGASRPCSAISAPMPRSVATAPTSWRPNSRTRCAGSTARGRT
ncbi:glycosyltransferase family 2 protein [Jhaorihella thermophila]